MDFIFDDESLDYLSKKKIDTITIVPMVSGACGGGGVQNPIVNVGAPKQNANIYRKYSADNITIYCPYFMRFKDDTAYLKYEKYLFLGNISVSNVVQEVF